MYSHSIEFVGSVVNKSLLLLVTLFLSLLLASRYSLGQTSNADLADANNNETQANTDIPSAQSSEHFFDFSKQFHEDEYETFLFKNDEQIYFVMDSNTAFRKGTILMLPDTYGKNLHLAYVKPLANQLADAGWQVILTFLPKSTYDVDEQVASNNDASTTGDDSSPADNTNDAQASNDNVASDKELTTVSINPMSGASNFTLAQATSCADKSSSYIKSILSSAKNLGARRIIAAQGMSAYCLLKANVSDANGLVLMSPYAPNRELNNELPELIANSPLPVLDLVSDWDSRWALATKKQRKISAIRQIKTHYRQRTIVGTTLSPIQSQYLSKEIYGWLSYLGY